MKLFIDSANLDEIRTAAGWGVVAGVTTNPSLAAKEKVNGGKGNFKDLVLEICKLIDGPVSVEVMATKAEEMVEEARDVAKWHKNIVIKIPCTAEGLKAVGELENEGIHTNVTLVFSPNQTLLAATAGATFISQFVGRLDDAGEDGMAITAESLQVINNYGFNSELIAASIRSTEHVKRAAKAGVHIATVPFKILEQLFRHPLTDAGIEKFLKDWGSR